MSFTWLQLKSQYINSQLYFHMLTIKNPESKLEKPIIVIRKKIKHLGIILTKYIQDSYESKTYLSQVIQTVNTISAYVQIIHIQSNDFYMDSKTIQCCQPGNSPKLYYVWVFFMEFSLHRYNWFNHWWLVTELNL